jgi:hypothetical protein
LVWIESGQGLPVFPKATPDDVDHEIALASGAAEPRNAGVEGRTVHRHAGEGYETFLRRIDEEHAQPLEYVVGTRAAPKALRKAARALGLGWVDVKEAKP